MFAIFVRSLCVVHVVFSGLRSSTLALFKQICKRLEGAKLNWRFFSLFQKIYTSLFTGLDLTWRATGMCVFYAKIVFKSRWSILRYMLSIFSQCENGYEFGKGKQGAIVSNFIVCERSMCFHFVATSHPSIQKRKQKNYVWRAIEPEIGTMWKINWIKTMS